MVAAWYANKLAFSSVVFLTVVLIMFLNNMYDAMTGTKNSINVRDKIEEENRQNVSCYLVHKIAQFMKFK